MKVVLNTITLTHLFIILVEEGRTSVHDIYLTFCRKKIWLTSSQWITYFFSISDPSFLFISNLSFAKSIAIAKTRDDFSLYHLLQKPEIAKISYDNILCIKINHINEVENRYTILWPFCTALHDLLITYSLFAIWSVHVY